MISFAFADGGVIAKNPSEHGGTWACLFLEEGQNAVEEDVKVYSGIVTPGQAGLRAISNNYTELLACVEALERLPDEWAGTLFTDSHCTRCRLVNAAPSMSGIPEDLQSRLWTARGRMGSFKVILLDGHPTKAQLASGIGKRGNPCSRWNVVCDKECGRLALEFLSKLPRPAGL